MGCFTDSRRKRTSSFWKFVFERLAPFFVFSETFQKHSSLTVHHFVVFIVGSSSGYSGQLKTYIFMHSWLEKCFYYPRRRRRRLFQWVSSTPFTTCLQQNCIAFSRSLVTSSNKLYLTSFFWSSLQYPFYWMVVAVTRFEGFLYELHP